MILENELFLTYHDAISALNKFFDSHNSHAEYEIKIESHVHESKMFVSLVIRDKT